MTDTTAAVTAAREAMDALQIHSGPLRDLLAVVDRLTSDLGSAQRALAATDDFRIADWKKLEMERDMAEAEVDRLTAPVTDAEVEALAQVFADVFFAMQAGEEWHEGGYDRPRVSGGDLNLAAAIVAATGRRYLPTETEWGTALRSTNGEVWDHFSWGENEAGARKELAEWKPDDTAPDVLVLVRRTPERPAGPWEVCDGQ